MQISLEEKGQQMQALNWQKAFLTDNPFASTPPTLLEEIPWADMATQRERIESRLRSSLATSPYALVLNWGPWGGGKTHAARYFSQRRVLETLAREVGVATPLSLIVNIPRGAKDVVRAIYLDVLGTIGLQQISHSLSKVDDKLGDEFPKVTRALVRDEELASALSLLAGRKARPRQRRMPFDTEEQIDAEEQLSLELRRYFLLSATTSEIRELKLGRNIQTGSDMIAVLTTIFNLLLYYGGGVQPQYSELIMWFDEMEEIISLPGKEQAILTSLIRDLTDYVSANLTVFINFSPRPGGELEDVGRYLGPAVESRVREQIFFGNLDATNTVQYVRDLLNAPKFRPEQLKRQCPDALFPLDDEVLRFLYHELASNVVPRYINEACSLVFERALAAGILDESGKRIGIDFVRNMAPEIQSIAAKGGLTSG